MRKISILRRKIVKAYRNPKNWEYSKFKGYADGTYFGYATLKDCIRDTTKNYVAYYGKGLRRWNLK